MIMNKFITAAAFSLALASSALAQSANGGSNGQGGADSSWTKGQQPPAAMEPMNNSGSMATDPTTTQSTTSGANDGTSGTSAAGTSADCPAGTPGAGTAGKTPASSEKINPNCP
jgi:hypothetical protein